MNAKQELKLIKELVNNLHEAWEEYRGTFDKEEKQWAKAECYDALEDAQCTCRINGLSDKGAWVKFKTEKAAEKWLRTYYQGMSYTPDIEWVDEYYRLYFYWDEIR